MKTTTLLRYTLIVCLAFGAYSCGEEEDETPSNNTPSNTLNGYTINEEGVNLTFTYADGSTDTYSSGSVFGWDSGQLLSGRYWRGFRIFLDGGQVENTLNFRFNYPQDMEWTEEMPGESALNNQRFRLEWSSELNDEWVEVYRIGTDPSSSAASGTVDLKLDHPTSLGEYDLFGEIDGEFWIYGQVTTVTGAFWKKEM